MENQFLTIKELSAYLHIKPATLYAKVGDIPHYKVGRLVLFKREDVDQWMEGCRRDPVDVERMAKAILRSTDRGAMDVKNVVKKTIERAKGNVLTSDQGRPDRNKGLGKEVKDEFVS